MRPWQMWLDFCARNAGLSLAISCGLASLAIAGNSNSLMDISRDGKLLACSNRDSGTVTLVDLTSLKKLREIPVGTHPEGVSFVGSSHKLAVAVHSDDTVLILDGDSGERLVRADVFDEPYGVVSSLRGDRIYVTLDFPGRVVEIESETGSISREITVGPFARGLAITPDETRLLVGEYYSAMIRAIDLKSGEIVDQWPGAGSDNLLRQLTVHPTRPKLYFPHIRSRVTAVRGEGSIFPYIGVVDLAPGEGSRRKRIPMDAFRSALVTANPWETAISADGRRFYAVFSGTNDMFVCDIVDDDYREISDVSYVELGQNPRAVRVSADGKQVYIYNALDFDILVLDAAGQQKIASIPVTDNPLTDSVLTGKQLFYSALQPMVGRRWISCSSCHPDGEADGRTWHNPEGLRNTQSFAGMAWTHPVHWSADRDEVQDFENTIRGPLMQGRGLIEGAVQKDLADPNRERSPRLDALAAYSNTHKFTISPYAKAGLSENAQRGRALFLSESTRCVTCHSGPLFTDSVPRPIAEIVRHDVGTGQDDPGEKMGPAYDTPTLLGVYRTSPYLHHGQAQSLEEVLTKFNSQDRHGQTSHLSETEIRDLAEFLRALPFENPEPLAKQSGLKKVVY